MLTALFATAVIAALLVHFVIVELPERREARSGPSSPEAVPVSEAVEGLPGGVFLQTTFTWTRLRDNGEVFLGLHPMLLSLIGGPLEWDLLPDGQEVKRGEPLLALRRGEREFQVYSPLDGRVVEANEEVDPVRGWSGLTERRGSWIYRIRPLKAEDEVPRWLLGSRAAEWTRHQYRQIRDYLVRLLPDEGAGVAAADGGELPAGVLSQVDEAAWESFQTWFLPPSGVEAER